MRKTNTIKEIIQLEQFFLRLCYENHTNPNVAFAYAGELR